MAAVAELDRPADLGRGSWATAASRREEAGLIDGALGLVGVDRGDEQGEVGVALDGDLACGGDAVDEGVVDPRFAHLGPGEHVEQEPLVRAAPVDHDRRLVEGPPEPEPAPRHGTVPARQHLGDEHRVAGREDVALGDGGVDPDARAGPEPQAGHDTRRGCEPALRVLGVEPGLQGMATRRSAARRRGGRPAPTCSWRRTRSTPVVSSTSPCSGGSRGYTSRKRGGPPPRTWRNATVATPQ